MSDNKRNHQRYSVGGYVEMALHKDQYLGNIVNASLGGILIEFERGIEAVDVGERCSLRIFDALYDIECIFDSQVVRKSGEGVAFQFSNKLNKFQDFFLTQWVMLAADPGKCV